MNKQDWSGFILALGIFSLIQLLSGSFNLVNTILGGVVTIAIIHIINVFRK